MKFNKIHILDDDKISSMLLAKKIESLGFTGEIDKSFTAAEAYPKIKGPNEVLFLDQNLECCIGKDVIDQLQQIGIQGLKIILISSQFNASHEELQNSSNNIIGKIVKPFSAEEIKKLLCQ